MMVFFIFWWIENSAWINVSNFWWKFHEKATSGNTGLNFSMICILRVNTGRSRADSKKKLSPVLPEVAFSWNFHQNFDTFIHAKFSINQKMESIIILCIENTTSY